jgi:hypothetical protein
MKKNKAKKQIPSDTDNEINNIEESKDENSVPEDNSLNLDET